MQSHPRWLGHGGELEQNMVHWRSEWQTTQYSYLETPMNSMKTNSLAIVKRRVSLIAQLEKNLPAMWETWIRSLGWEVPLEK